MRAYRRVNVEVGDIVRITVFGSWMDDNPDSVLWARVIADQGDIEDYPPAYVTFLAGTGKAAEYPGDDWDGPWSLDVGDVFTVVPEDEVPGWVWADHAKRQLIGGADG
jgi:hypothetical protein